MYCTRTITRISMLTCNVLLRSRKTDTYSCWQPHHLVYVLFFIIDSFLHTDVLYNVLLLSLHNIVAFSNVCLSVIDYWWVYSESLKSCFDEGCSLTKVVLSGMQLFLLFFSLFKTYIFKLIMSLRPFENLRMDSFPCEAIVKESKAYYHVFFFFKCRFVILATSEPQLILWQTIVCNNIYIFFLCDVLLLCWYENKNTEKIMCYMYWNGEKKKQAFISSHVRKKSI